MRNESSYGIIPLRRYSHGWEVLLIQHQAGHWAFPKGHAEEGESPLQAAARELEEETGLTVIRYLATTPFTENYFFTHQGHKIHKTVHYFLAEVQGTVNLQEEEISASQWVPIQQAADYVTFKQAKGLCTQVQNLLSTL